MLVTITQVIPALIEVGVVLRRLVVRIGPGPALPLILLEEEGDFGIHPLTDVKSMVSVFRGG